MILLFLFSLLLFFSDAGYSNSFRVHISNILRLKCDELPYRTAFFGTRCYFAVDKEVKISEASAQCSSIVPGAKLSLDVSSVILNGMMVDKSKYHRTTNSSGAKKQSICVVDTGYTCKIGEQSRINPGKCVAGTGVPKTYPLAESFCSTLGMEIPTIDNEIDNLVIRASIVKDLAWIRHFYRGANRKLDREKYFSKYSTCLRPNVLASGPETIAHIRKFPRYISVLDKAGYWGSREDAIPFGVVCVKNAENDFTPGMKPCIAHHELDEETGLCEWTGPKDACLQAIDYLNRTKFLTMPNFPKETYKEVNYVGHYLNDLIVKVIVRRGCMYSGVGHLPGAPFEVLVKGKNDLIYGEHRVPSYYFGELPTWGDGLTIIKCFCDPTEATLNDHIPGPPVKKKCIEHHIFNETTQSCEWKHDPKYCGEIITTDGRRQMIAIPDWPRNVKYDVDHWEAKRDEDFHTKITEVIVRQHCWMQMYQWTVESRRTLQPSGYGRHQVASHYNGHLGAPHDGTHRVVCECIR